MEKDILEKQGLSYDVIHYFYSQWVYVLLIFGILVAEFALLSVHAIVGISYANFILITSFLFSPLSLVLLTLVIFCSLFLSHLPLKPSLPHHRGRVKAAIFSSSARARGGGGMACRALLPRSCSHSLKRQDAVFWVESLNVAT